MATPLVSVIIPTYNRAHVLGRAIHSVLAQTYEGLELIVVDDASTDNTQGLVERIKDSRVRYLRHDHNKGGGAARNTGIAAAQGEYIAFQDSDDEWLVEKLERQVSLLQTTGSAVAGVYCGYIRRAGDRVSYLPGPQCRDRKVSLVTKLLCLYCPIGTQTLLLKRKPLIEVGCFDERLRRRQDGELLLRLSLTYELEVVDEPLVVMNILTERVTNDVAALIKAEEIILAKHQEYFNKHPGVLASRFYGLGREKCHNGVLALGRRDFINAIKVSPLHWRAWGALLLSMFGTNGFIAAARLHRRLRT
ncbi:MAG: glycosyltransferase [Nitrococcus sp.]|nr:glycosyltransferase [Nitrococcus sp.]